MQTEIAPRPLWTIHEVSRYLSLPTSTLYRWKHDGVGPRWLKVGEGPRAMLRYRPEEVEAWLEANTTRHAH